MGYPVNTYGLWGMFFVQYMEKHNVSTMLWQSLNMYPMFNICSLELHTCSTEDSSWGAAGRKVWDTNQNLVNTTLLLYNGFVYSEIDAVRLHDN